MRKDYSTEYPYLVNIYIFLLDKTFEINTVVVYNGILKRNLSEKVGDFSGDTTNSK